MTSLTQNYHYNAHYAEVINTGSANQWPNTLCIRLLIDVIFWGLEHSFWTWSLLWIFDLLKWRNFTGLLRECFSESLNQVWNSCIWHRCKLRMAWPTLLEDLTKLTLYKIRTRRPFCWLQEKKEEIWLSPMTKAPTPTEKSKISNETTQNTPPKTSITQR